MAKQTFFKVLYMTVTVGNQRKGASDMSIMGTVFASRAAM